MRRLQSRLNRERVLNGPLVDLSTTKRRAGCNPVLTGSACSTSGLFISLFHPGWCCNPVLTGSACSTDYYDHHYNCACGVAIPS